MKVFIHFLILIVTYGRLRKTDTKKHPSSASFSFSSPSAQQSQQLEQQHNNYQTHPQNNHNNYKKNKNYKSKKPSLLSFPFTSNVEEVTPPPESINVDAFKIPPWVKEQLQIEEPMDSTSSTTEKPNPCLTDPKEFGYINGQLSATQTFYRCLLNISDPMSLPSFWNGTLHGIVPIYTSIQLNNLHQIDAVAGTVTLDFYLRLYWQDNRFAMPEFWKLMSPELQTNGFEVTPFFTIGNATVEPFYPDIRFHDVSELDYIVQTLRLNSSNVFFWSRHTVATFMQPKMLFTDYPADSQIINIRYGSYAYDQTTLAMAFTSSAPISFNTNYDGSYTFQSNPEWEYDGSITSYQTYVSGSGFLNAIFHIGVVRKGSGIVLRLILPIALLCFLGGLTFWAAYEHRVDSTITLLLAVSALYIVILANIPLVGYLTSMDTFIFWMFLLLCFSVILHQIFAVLQGDRETWPLRIFLGRLVETMGRISIFPLVTYFFLTTIGDINPTIQTGLIIITILVSSFVTFKEIRGLLGAYKESVKLLLSKLNSEEILLKELSFFELFFVNRLEFHRWSISAVYLSEYLEKTGGLNLPKSKSIPLRKYSIYRQNSLNHLQNPLPYNEEDVLERGMTRREAEAVRNGDANDTTAGGGAGRRNSGLYTVVSTDPTIEIDFTEENPQQRRGSYQESKNQTTRRGSARSSIQPSTNIPLSSAAEDTSYRKRIGNTRNRIIVHQPEDDRSEEEW